MMSHRWRYKGRGSVLIRFFTSSTVRCPAARVILAIPSLFCFQSSPPLFYHRTRIGISSSLPSPVRNPSWTEQECLLRSLSVDAQFHLRFFTEPVHMDNIC